MPAPLTTDEFLRLVRMSGLLEEARVTAYIDELRGRATLSDTPGKLAGRMVADGLIPTFQAEQFLTGKWRRFALGKHYQVLERLGSGNAGSVYLCKHKAIPRLVAVKVLPSAMSSDSASVERFFREARALAGLFHPNIVRA